LGSSFNDDYERTIISLSAMMGNVQYLINSPELLEPYEDLSTIITAELQRPVTRLAITRSTSLLRETVRRKVAIKDARGGVRLTPGALRAQPFVGAVAQNDADMRRLVRLIRL
jgi:hypothetical protein